VAFFLYLQLYKLTQAHRQCANWQTDKRTECTTPYVNRVRPMDGQVGVANNCLKAMRTGNTLIC